jgi:flagellar hook-basal body complex protein FliE
MDKLSANQLLNTMQQLIEQSQSKPSQKAEVAGANFQEIFSNALSQVNELQLNAGSMTEKFERGEPGIELSDVMMAVQKANVSFEAVLQVRNRLVSAYQEIMNMPI